jgi:hypothetical protein
VLEQLLLAPADQRRDQQRGEAEVVERLRGEAQRGHQVAHRERRAEPQPVDALPPAPLRMQPRDDQAGQLAPRTSTITRPAWRARAALHQREAALDTSA